MTDFNPDLHPRGIAGLFVETNTNPPESTLLFLDTVPVAVPPGLNEDYVECHRFAIDGADVVVITDGDGSFQVYGEPYVAAFTIDDESARLSKPVIERNAVIAYTEEMVRTMRARVGVVPELDAALLEAIARAEADAKLMLNTTGVDGLTPPPSWDGESVLTPAKDLVDNRLDGDDVGARADYAEVGEEGVAYGYQMNADLLGGILVGPRGTDEDEMSYAERLNNAASLEVQATVKEFFRTEYGAELIDNGDYGDVAAEFFVEYGSVGIDRSSVELMDYRVENETKLLTLRNSYEAGGNVQRELAARLGYRQSYDRGADGAYVRVDEAAAAVRDAEFQAHKLAGVS